MSQIPSGMEGSAALQFVISRGWDWKTGTHPNIVLEHCPYCNKEDHCYMEIHGASEPDQSSRDGLHLCQRCGKSGNLYALKKKLGVVIEGVSGQKEWGASQAKVDQLPDVEACHKALMADDEVLDYLVNTRGFSLDIIQKQKLGLTEHYFAKAGKVKAVVYPYLVNGNIIWAKYRTVPPSPKDFNSPRGWDAVLYNGEILKPGIKDIVLVEGEADVVAALDKGVTNICGVPGANVKKAEWITTLDQLMADGMERIYVLYDKDKVGQKAAQVLASRIGIEKCYKIILPDFEVITETGESRKGKDLNEWFSVGGGTIEAFEELKKSATLFDVDGVSSATDAIDEFTEELDGKGAGQKYVWPIVSDIVQFDEGDVIDILAPEKIGKTTLGLNLLEYMVDTYHEDAVVICTEMSRAKLARKWVSHKAQVPDFLPKNQDERDLLTWQFKKAIPQVKELAANREGNLYFCYPKYKSMDEVYKLIVDCIRRYGVKWIMVDNLQRLCDTTIGSKNRTQWLSEISKNLSQIAKDYNVQMVRILQPHRIAGDKLATTDSVDGASQVGKDCDCMLVANRNRIGEVDKETFKKGGLVQSDCTFGPEMLLTCGLSRYSAGGTVEVYFDGSTSTVHKLNEGKIKAMEAQAQMGEGYNAALNALGLQKSEPVQGEDVSF